MKEIIMASGHLVQVSDEDYDFLNQWNWCLVGGRGCPYAHRHALGVNIYIHHVVLARMELIIPPGYEGDHKDRNTFNNQRGNLRVVTKSINRHNTTLQHNNTSGVRGVNYNPRFRKWQARISINKNRIHLGWFLNQDDANLARKKAEEKYHGQA